MLLLAALLNDRIDETDDLLVYLVGLKNSVNNYIFRHFVSASLNHDHLFPGGSYSQGKI